MEVIYKQPYIGVIIHGYASHSKRFNFVEAVLSNCFPGIKIICPQLPLGLFSTTHPNDAVKILYDKIDALWEAELISNGSIKPKIIIIGHSAGCLLARKLYATASGETIDCSFANEGLENGERDWAKHVERIILLAGVNIGWTKTEHLASSRAAWINLLIPIGYLISIFKKPFAFYIKKGSNWVQNLRLQWIWMIREAANKKVGEALVVQLLGTIDDIVAPSDNVDPYTGSNFIYLEVPESGHLNVIKMDHSLSGKKRAVVLRKALMEDKVTLLKEQQQTVGEVASICNNTITDVVFVIHGIRDTAYWTQKMANRIRAYGSKKNRSFATETSTYGYFSMLKFLLPFQRKLKMEWLVDKYIENMVLYPNAVGHFSFFGHSNGTYLLASAFNNYPAVTFKNVVLAGSVVDKRFDWQLLKEKGKVANFYNLIATIDWVVAIFPKAFQFTSIVDLGSGGFDGFNDIENNKQLKYIKGSHSEGTLEKYWDQIACFIVDGEVNNKAPELEQHKRPYWIKIIGATAPMPFLIIVLLLLLLGFWIYYHCIHKDVSTENIILIELIYCFTIWKIITRY